MAGTSKRLDAEIEDLRRRLAEWEALRKLVVDQLRFIEDQERKTENELWEKLAKR